jgi:hypothetical protein
MKAERDRLRRLQRLERVRDIAKQTAATEAARAESTLAQLEGLAERTRQLAAHYTGREGLRDAATLQQLGRFARGLQGIAETTDRDAASARQVADARMADLAAAERRRAAVEERADKQAKVIANRGQSPILSSRKAIGTELD